MYDARALELQVLQSRIQLYKKQYPQTVNAHVAIKNYQKAVQQGEDLLRTAQAELKKLAVLNQVDVELGTLTLDNGKLTVNLQIDGQAWAQIDVMRGWVSGSARFVCYPVGAGSLVIRGFGAVCGTSTVAVCTALTGGGQVDQREVFVQQVGFDTKLYIEIQPFAGNSSIPMAHSLDFHTITLVGVAAPELMLEDGFAYLL